MAFMPKMAHQGTALMDSAALRPVQIGMAKY